jgi:hypothetical protein
VWTGSIDFNADSTGFKLIGVALHRHATIEGLHHFGSGDDDVSETMEWTRLHCHCQPSVPAGGPRGPVARVGVISWDAELSASGLGSFGDSGTDLTYGIGAQFRIWSLGLRGEYEVFDLDGTDVDMFSVGFTWTFF